MKIKVYITETVFKIINIGVNDSVKTISQFYTKWEYVL